LNYNGSSTFFLPIYTHPSSVTPISYDLLVAANVRPQFNNVLYDLYQCNSTLCKPHERHANRWQFHASFNPTVRRFLDRYDSRRGREYHHNNDRQHDESSPRHHHSSRPRYPSSSSSTCPSRRSIHIVPAASHHPERTIQITTTNAPITEEGEIANRTIQYP